MACRCFCSYQAAQDAFGDGAAGGDIGSRIILSSSFTGGDRHMQQQYQVTLDRSTAMAACIV